MGAAGHRQRPPAGGGRNQLVNTAPPRRRDSPGNTKGKEDISPLPLSTYSAPGGLRQGPGRAAQSPAEAESHGNGSRRARLVIVDDTSGS